MKQTKTYLEDEASKAEQDLRTFIRSVDYRPAEGVMELIEISAAESIRRRAVAKADLLVIGTRGMSGIRNFVLGSVAYDLLRSSEIDILVVP